MEADIFFTEGCGRCPLGGTPGCKVHIRREELQMLRQIMLHSGLTETRKWGVPCYVHRKKNVVLLSTLKDCATLRFLKGSLMSDPGKLLHKPGENSQAARYMKFTSPEEVLAQSAEISAYVREAVRLEESGEKVVFKAPQDQTMCDEFAETLKNDSELSAAFYALTPGRQRGYILFFGGAKQAKTRLERIAKWRNRILEGKGMQD